MVNTGWDLDKSSNATAYVKTEFTKFPVGITRIRVVDDVPTWRWAHWWVPAKRFVTCAGVKCPICEIRKNQKANGETQTYNMTKRYSFNVVNRESQKVEVLEQGVTFFKDVKELMDDLNNEGKKLQDVDIKVRRRGTGQDDTSYRLDVGDATPLNTTEVKALEFKTDFTEYYKVPDREEILRLLAGETYEQVFYNKEETVVDDNEEEVTLK